MSVRSAVSIEEYLHTSFPDVDYEFNDGEILERSLPDREHSRTQLVVGAFFLGLQETLEVFPYSEFRLRLSRDRVVVADLAIFHRHEPPSVPEEPPLIVIEILSPDDRMSKLRQKLDEYKIWGVPHVWLIDRRQHRLYTYDGRLTEVSSFPVQELGIEMTPEMIFR